jgi:hypothetical protein
VITWVVFNPKKERYRFRHGHKEQWLIEEMAKTLEVSRSGYYRLQMSKASMREKQSLALLPKYGLFIRRVVKPMGVPRNYSTPNLGFIFNNR